jgi:hypothetical protein
MPNSNRRHGALSGWARRRAAESEDQTVKQQTEASNQPRTKPACAPKLD